MCTTDHNVDGLASILGLTDPHNQSRELPRNVAPRDQWCPPTRVGKASNNPSVLQTVLVKIVTEILFWHCAFGEQWNNRLDSRSQTSALRKDRDLNHISAQERTKQQGQEVGTGAAPWKPQWRVRHCWNIIIQASTWQHYPSTIGSILREVGSQGQQQPKNIVGRSTLPESWETLTHQPHRFSKERQAHTGIDTTGMGTHLAGATRSLGYSQYKCIYHEIMIMSREESKLDCLKMNSRGATNEAPTYAVPMHAPQTSSLWRGVGEVGSACEVGCRRRVQPRPFWKLT